VWLLLQAAAEDAAVHSRKDLHPAHPGFKALLEMGGASAQVTFMPDAQWHKHSTGSSKQKVRLKLPGEAGWVTRDGEAVWELHAGQQVLVHTAPVNPVSMVG
jgi:hypothetical protein